MVGVRIEEGNCHLVVLVSSIFAGLVVEGFVVAVLVVDSFGWDSHRSLEEVDHTETVEVATLMFLATLHSLVGL